MKKPTLSLESYEEKELLKVLLRLSASQTDQRIVAMGSPIPMSIINSSVIDIFFAWKEGQPSLRDLQNLMCALENLSERMIDFGLIMKLCLCLNYRNYISIKILLVRPV